MFTLALLTIILFPLTLGASVLTSLFSSEELEEMGVNLEQSHA
jgi:hypothetical protein